jgi:hypothetical protein
MNYETDPSMASPMGKRPVWVNGILTSHEPLPPDEEVERELDRIQKRAEADAI